MKQKISFYDTAAACSAMQRTPCALWTLYLLRHIAPNNLRKFGCSDGITGGSHLADLAALLNICFLKQLSLFPRLIRISPLSNRVFLS